MPDVPSDDDFDEFTIAGFSLSAIDNSKTEETGINSDLPIIAENYLQGLIDLINSMYEVIEKFEYIADNFEGAVMWHYYPYSRDFSYDNVRIVLEEDYRCLAYIRKRISEFKNIKYPDITKFNVNKSNYERVLVLTDVFNRNFTMNANHLKHMIKVASKIHYRIAVSDSLYLQKQSISAIKEINKIIKRYNKYLDMSFMMRFPLMLFK
jgi:hypothetical protein